MTFIVSLFVGGGPLLVVLPQLLQLRLPGHPLHLQLRHLCGREERRELPGENYLNLFSPQLLFWQNRLVLIAGLP